MPLTRLDNLISSKTGKYLYVSPDDFNATDSLSNRGNSPVTPFKSIQRAFLEIARYSYTPGPSNDRFDQFSIMLMPGIHYIDNRPGLVDTSGIDVFDFNQALNAWGDDPILDISNPDNILYKFNNTEGGAIIPRGSSLVGYDLRRTTVRPLYVPDPASVTVPRSAIFNVTGGCYFWQFTLKDGQTTAESPLYNPAAGTGEVYYDPNDFTRKTAPNYSHHKLTVFEYADKEELQLFYRKIAKAFSAYQPTIDDVSPEGIPEFDYNVQENRIVGPLSDSRVIESLKFTDATTNPSIPASTTEIEVTTKVDHGYFAGQFVAISGTEIDDEIEGFWSIYDISDDPRKFTYRVPFVVSGIGQGLSSGITVSVDTTPALGQNSQVLAEVDSVESASPYVFNVSIRSVWGICGIWANGLKATGFKSMVIAQYTGVSLQRDDRAFIRYDEYANTWNQASLVDAFATVPYHAKGDSYWKDDWRNFHVRASDDAFIQNVSIFAVGFADHFLMESGGDMSITNSNSNFGNTSLHAIGFKGFSFNQDKAGYITDIIPPQQVVESETNRKKVLYYTIDVQGTIQDGTNRTKLYLGGTDLDNPLDRPAATIGGYRIGGKSGDKLFVKLDKKNNIDTFQTTLSPTGFVKYIAKGTILNPSNYTINNVNVDAANLIESNRRMIQEEVFGYILEKYPRLQNISYVNPSLNPAAGRYLDAKNLIIANRQEIVDTAFDEMVEAFGIGNIQGVADGKCKRDIGFIVDAIAEDLRDGGNANIIAATREYFDGNGDAISNGLVGEEVPSVFAFNRARDLCKKAIANLLTVKASIYDPETDNLLAPYGVISGSTGSAALGLDSEGVTVDKANRQDPAGRYKDARNRIIANRDFILDAALAEVAVYHDDFYFPGTAQTTAKSRFYDGFRMIRRNSKEIADRALAKIAFEHPDFYFPGDAQTTADSRFYDSYRLIQQNKDEIQDRALAQIAINHPDFYIPGSAQTTTQSRFFDSYRLIQQNRTDIINTAWNNMVAVYPGVAGTETKCKRDLGYFVDAISLDIFMGGNKYARKFVSMYFASGAPIGNGLVGEEAESIRAFQEARDLMGQAVANQLAVKDLSVTADPATGSNIDPNSCANVQSAIDSLTLIVTDVIAAGSLAGMAAETPYSIEAGELKCRRDLGFFIDAVSLDLFIRGNEYSYRFAAEYFDVNGAAISNGLVGETAESITAFNKARDMMKLAITNSLYEKDLTLTADPATGDNQDQASCANVQSALDTLTSIVTTIVAAGNLSSLPVEINKGSAPAGMEKCGRDIGYFIDAIAVDLFTGGNKHTRTFIQQYFDGNTPISNGLAGEEAESITAFNEASAYMQQAVTNQLYYRDLTVTADPLTGDNQDPNSCANVRSAISTLTTYVTDALTAGNLNTLPTENAGSFQTGELKCRRDLGYVVDAVAQDLWFGGNEYTIAATKEYFNGNSLIANGVDNEIAPSITAFKRAADLMNRAVNNQYYDRDLGLTLDQTGDPAFVADIHADAYNLVLDNKEFIAAEAYERMLAAYPSYQPSAGNTKQDCLDDVYDVLEEVMWDVKFGGNSKTYDAAEIYVTNIFNGQPIDTFLDAERDEAAKVFLEAKNIAIQCLRNETVSVSAGNTLTQVKDLTIVNDWDDDFAPLPQCGSAAGAVDTLFGIILQAVGNDGGVGNLNGVTRTAPSQPSTYTLGNCSDVLATIDTLIGIVCDALYAGSLDTLPPLSNGEWDCANVRSSIENLFDIITDAISSGSLAGLPVLNRGDFIVNAESSKCFRDVAYIVDAIVNDLKYGGNINSVQAGEAYYVGTQLDYIDGEKAETIDAWNYVGQMAIAAMRNFDFLAYNCATTNSSALVTIPDAAGTGTRDVPASAIINVGDNSGIIIGMKVEEYPSGSYTNGLLNAGATPVTTNIPEGTYVKSLIGSDSIELGTYGSRLDSGVNQNCQQPPSSTVSLYFTFEQGAWANTTPNTVVVGPEASDPDVIQDTTTSPSQRECASTAAAILQLTENITTIINTGLTKVVNGVTVPTVDRVEPTFNTALLASRATVFTIDTTGYGSTDAHDFETGTPVRLVPRPRFNPATGQYVDVDKRVIRLPNGFDTNTTYYVIAPGRATQPVDYSGTTYFNDAAVTRLMLATSKENAAAGIYIYAAETESIDPDIEIDLYQFVLDDKYDLHTYSCELVNTVVGGIETDIAHIFDKPSTATTPQKVFFRAIEGSDLPDLATNYASDPTVAITSGVNAGKINPSVEFYVRYQTSKVFTIHKTLADALNDVNPITFNNANGPFRVFANKKRSPMRFDPGFNGSDTDNGKWYLQCLDRETEGNAVFFNEIFYRINESDYQSKPTTTDTWYERVDDTRDANERTYKLRYVIPKYIENARDPINGFVIKTRTDDTRKLVPQKLLLKPVAGNVYGARFENPQQPGEFIGFTKEQFTADDTLNDLNAYDPFRRPLTGEDQDTDYRAIARFTSGVAATIQSGRYVEDDLDPSINYLEITVFDHGIDTKNFPGLRNEILTTVKISAPQGGAFVANKTQSITGNAVSFAGNSSGTAYIHAYYSVGGDHYLIIKGISGAKGTASLEYSEFQGTRFTQGAVFADMLDDQDMGKSLPLKTHIRKNFPEYFYKQNGANVYTITPGDRIQDDAGIEYYVYSVEDTGVIEDTFYIFDSAELQKRIPGQQDGIYYLTALRGNISPYPTGAGAGGNFRKFKFSQPVGKIYPLNYRNDPLWFQKSGTTNEEKDYYAQLIDPPQAFSAADNYIHGKVTINDTKHSVTKELIIDLLKQPAFVENTYTNDNEIQAQLGNATSGSEDRRIPIAGDSTVVSDQRYYVELRRPSIARAGNHTFEYLGFGPGNYSTGLPARQEIVLEPEEDFYAQSKKQDAGIVFYTGINSQGDLYIGNRRINAITGEETFIDRAVLADDGDEDDVIGQLVTTFDTPVTFNQNITIVGGADGDLVNNINSPILVNVPDNQLTNLGAPLVVYSLVSATDPVTGYPQDTTLDRNSFFPNTSGDIRLGKNRVDAAVFGFNPRGEGQNYKIQTHAPGGIGSNISPNQDTLISQGGSRISVSQYITYGGSVLPSTGDMALKGGAVNKNGSLGWIFANIYTTIPNNVISSLKVIVDQSVNVASFTFIDSNSNPVPVGSLNIKSGSEIRLQNINYSGVLNGTWPVLSTEDYPFNPLDNVVYFQVTPRTGTPIGAFDETWSSGIINNPTNPSPNAIVSFSVSNWKEFGVLGAEALRTETETIGDYKLGINTINRATHDAYKDAFVEVANTDPRANLDVVGNAYISGRKTTDWLAHDDYADREKNAISDALVVGGDSADIDAYATLRVSTEEIAITEPGRGNNAGKVGINVTDAELDRALVVKGDARFTEDVRFERDIEIHGDGTLTEVRTDTTTGTFNLITDANFTGTLNIANSASVLNFVNTATTIEIGNDATTNSFYFGNDVAGDQFFYFGSNSDHSNFFIGNTPDSATVAANGSIAVTGTGISKVIIGGAFGNSNQDQSYTRIGSQILRIDGDAWLGFRRQGGTARMRSQASVIDFFSNSGGPSTINFALNASEINIAGQGGKTTINNQLEVIASAKFNSNILLCGGLSSFSFSGNRAQMGSVISTHDDGVNPDGTFIKNVDILNVLVLDPLTDGYNAVDTAGSGTWGGASDQDAETFDSSAEPVAIPALSGDEYYLPIKYSPNKSNGDPYLTTGDYIIINSAIVGSTNHPEIVQIVEVVRSVAPYYLKVKRRPFGAFGGVLSNHADTTAIYKVNVQFDATWIEQPVDGAGAQDNFYLAEFGGDLTVNDYILLSRDDATGTPEYVKVVTPLSQEVQKFRIADGTDCDNTDGDVFVVDSKTGDTYIGGSVTINSSILQNGGCFLTSSLVTGDLVPESEINLTYNITNISDEDIANVALGDTVKLRTGTASSEFFYPWSQVVEIENTGGDQNSVKLSVAAVNFATEENLQFEFGKNEVFAIDNGHQQSTLHFDTCSGTLEIGNQYRRFEIERILPDTETVAETVARYDGDVFKTIRVYGYQQDPKSIQADGPKTTLSSGASTGLIPNSVYLTCASVGTGDGAFAVGDLIMVGDTADIDSKGTGGNQWEIMKIASIDAVNNILRCLPGQEGTTARALTDYPAITTTVIRLLKHPETSLIYDIQQRTRESVGFVSLILEKGYISQTIMDYAQYFRFYDTTGVLDDEWFYVPTCLRGKYHETTMNEQVYAGQFGERSQRIGNIVINNDLEMIGGQILMYDSTRKTKILNFLNDGGHSDHQGELYFDAKVTGRGTITIYGLGCPEETNSLTCDPTFAVNQDGDVTALRTFSITGIASTNPPSSPILTVKNLGVQGGSEFTVNHDCSIDSFGYDKFYTRTGGRHTRYLASGTDAENLYLKPNINYFVNVTDGDNFVVYLPEAPISGDTVTIIDVGGNLTYNTSLIVRAQGTGVKVQGDSTGTTLGGLASAYPSGELVVQTAHAAFTLIYLGGTDTTGAIVSSSVNGWWLKEV